MSDVPPTANDPGMSPSAVIEKGFQIAQTSISPKPASTSRPPSPPRPLLTMVPDDRPHVSTLLSKRSSSSLSRSPAETSFLEAVNDEPGPPRMWAVSVVTGSSPAQPCGPALSVIVQASSWLRVRSTAPFSAAYISVATYVVRSTFSSMTYFACAGPMPAGGS
jgi:hypothetical protein